MGLLSQDKSKDNDEKNKLPWGLPNGVYLSDLKRINVKPAPKGDKSIFELIYLPKEDSYKHLESQPDNPLEVPDLSIEFDSNIKEQKLILFSLIGRPMKNDANPAEPKWDTTGFHVWNGKSNEMCKVSGSAELKISSKPPNKKKDGNGYWPIVYKIDDISKPGESAKQAAQAAAMLLDDDADDESEEEADVPDAPKPKGRRGK